MSSPSPTRSPAPSGRGSSATARSSRTCWRPPASTVGTTLQAAALGKQVYDITDSKLALGLLGLVEFLPALLLLPLTGSAADRFDRRHIAAIGLAVEVLTSIAVLRLRRSDPTRRVPIFLIAALFGTARAFVSPALRSIPPLVAPTGGLPRLIALYSGTWQFGLIIGPASSGLLYDLDPAVPYAAAAVCFAVAAVVVADPRRPPRPGAHAGRASGRRLHHALEGLRFIRGQPVLLGAIALDLFAVLFGGAVALLPAIAEDRLGVGNVGYGWLRAAPGIGAVVVTALLAIRRCDAASAARCSSPSPCSAWRPSCSGSPRATWSRSSRSSCSPAPTR